jgi:hypothetical protein
VPTSALELWSDVVGFVAAVIMLLPAVRADRLLQFITQFRQATADARKRGSGDPNLDKYLDWLANTSGTWSSFDGWCLRLGALLLVLSFALKLCHHLGTRAWFG